jgi:hypothetical protein
MEFVRTRLILSSISVCTEMEPPEARAVTCIRRLSAKRYCGSPSSVGPRADSSFSKEPFPLRRDEGLLPPSGLTPCHLPRRGRLLGSLLEGAVSRRLTEGVPKEPFPLRRDGGRETKENCSFVEKHHSIIAALTDKFPRGSQ